MPDAVRDASRVPLLITVSDQVQWQWSAMQLLSHPEGAHLMHVFRVDPFHRGWNNFKAACRAGREAQNHATSVIAAASSDGAPAPAEHRAQLSNKLQA